jgi:hypothetical protein
VIGRGELPKNVRGRRRKDERIKHQTKQKTQSKHSNTHIFYMYLFLHVNKKTVDNMASTSNQQWSIEVPSTSRSPDHPSGGRGNIRRSCDPLASPVLGAFGVRTLYEALRRGRDINPLGPCLGFRATR